jgi:hypothetical protein
MEHTDQSLRLVFVFFSMTPRVQVRGKGKDALHGHAECVERFGDRLATPVWLRRVTMRQAQIVDLYYNVVPERATEVRRVRVLGWLYSEAAPASVTKTVIGTECKLVDRRCVPGREVLAARCTRTSHSEWALSQRRIKPRKIGAELTGSKCTVFS